MASVHRDRRSKKHAPRWLTNYLDPDGSRRLRRLHGVHTKAEAVARLRKIEKRLADGLYGDPADQPVPPSAGMITASVEAWSRGLTNRNGAGDGATARRWLVTAPPLQLLTLEGFNVDAVHRFVAWLETVDLAPGSRLNLFTILSRWASWAASVRGGRLLASNPCKLLSREDRPQAPAKDKTRAPWVKDDATLHRLMAALPHPLDLALWLGNRSGLRLGETFGLRLGDLDELSAGWIRVCRSFGGPLKEARRDEWPVKWVPATVDAPAVLGSLIAQRRSAGASDEDLLFVPATVYGRRANGWRGWHANTLGAAWRRVRAATGYAGDWKSSTRHSFASRHIMNGVPIEAVSRAMGHSSVKTTRDAYEHILKVRYPDGLRAPMLPPQEGRTAEAKPPTDADAREQAAMRGLVDRSN